MIPSKSLNKKARRDFKGYPAATVAFYGPTDQLATKIAVGILLVENAEPAEMKRWLSEKEIRTDPVIFSEVEEFIEQHKVKSVLMVDRIIGCPHEAGIDYPSGQTCSVCEFWVGKDRWTGETEN